MNSMHRARAAWQAFFICLLLGAPLHALAATPKQDSLEMTAKAEQVLPLSARQEAIVPIAAFAAVGDMARLNAALEQGLDAGLSVSDVREVLVQLYAYAGFPRSLNALTALMTVLDARRQRGIVDDPGREPDDDIPTGKQLLAAGTANQTALAGAPVKGALFEFAPAADQYLKTHLFGDIFERDNLDWEDREIATIAMLSALTGTDSQLQSHMRMGMNAGLTPVQLHLLTQVLDVQVGEEAARRALAALTASLPKDVRH